MKAAITLLFILAFHTPQIALASGGRGDASNVRIIRVEQVSGDALAHEVSVNEERLIRVVALAANGRYLVVVRSNIGVTRMKGAYLDSLLAVPDGTFSYYHPNGRIESTGSYVKGVKSGTWERYDMNGHALATRTYSGEQLDDLLATEGVIEKAGQAGQQRGVRVTQRDRRWSVPMDL
ncbi:MAG TPA: hypothetical protein PKJ19_09600 [Flavobacteriales bacterium]|nr:hypothetical protein [Flavobacteriales bacterium]HNU55403.1 hypothetical protein [Flavobacteriales bacterium]